MRSNPFLLLFTALILPQTVLAQLQVSVLKPPHAAVIDGQNHFFYELVVENHGDKDVTVNEVRIDGGSLGQGRINATEILKRFQLLSLIDFDTVKDWLNFPKPAKPPVPSTIVPTGRSALIYLQLDAPVTPALPSSIHNEVSFTGVNSQTSTVNFELKIDTAEPIVLRSPFSEGRWIAINPPWDGSAHRRSVQRLREKNYIGQRFAIDWMRVGDDGFIVKPGSSVNQNASYHGYGTPVRAVGNATVVKITDGLAENTPGNATRAIVINEQTVGGNAVILDLGKGHFAFYAHLQPGKISVKVGDHVKAGELIGLLGNSGNSIGPHLHFHVCDAPSELSCQGIPYVFETFTHQAIQVEGNDLEHMKVSTTGDKQMVHDELVWINQLIEFHAK